MVITAMGFSVPKDISVMGFDNHKIPFDDYNGPRISCIQQPLYEMGRDSILAVTDILDGNIETPVVRTYDTTIAEYETVCEPGTP